MVPSIFLTTGESSYDMLHFRGSSQMSIISVEIFKDGEVLYNIVHHTISKVVT
ncbi:unnamed protein product, partial [Sphenostylis stenocarpa]